MSEESELRNIHAGSRVVILFPVLNESKYIASALDSVINQTHSNWILVGQDNASDDATLEILQRYARRDSRIVVLESPKRIRAASNWREVYDYAYLNFDSDYMCYLGGDDLWLTPNYLELLLETFELKTQATVSAPTILLMDQHRALESRFEVYVTGSHSLDRMQSFIQNWSNVNLIYGLYESQYFAIKMNETLSRFSDYPGCDWWWGIAVARDQEVVANERAVYFKRINKDDIYSGTIKDAFINVVMKFEFFYRHLYAERLRLKNLTYKQKEIILIYTTKRWVFQVFSAWKHLCKSLIFLLLKHRP